MHDLCGVFLFDSRNPQHDALVRDHYDRLVRDNPDVPIAPVTCESTTFLPGAIDIKDAPQLWCDPHNTTWPARSVYWMQNDQMLWRYLLTPGHVEAERYALIEWDVLSQGMSLREFYVNVWDADVAGIELVHYLPTHRPWAWWPVGLGIPEEKWVGIVPSCMSLWSRKAAEYLAHTDPETVARGFKRIQCEVRPFLMAALAGFELRDMPERSKMCHTQGGPARYSKAPGIYHPIQHEIKG